MISNGTIITPTLQEDTVCACVCVYVLSVDNRDAEIVICQLEFFSQKPGSGPWVSAQVVHVFLKTRICIQQFCCCCINKQILQT
jgi:hypothetical protein